MEFIRQEDREFLEKYKFVGTDATMEIALFEYGMLYSEPLEALLIVSHTVDNYDVEVEVDKWGNTADTKGNTIKFDWIAIDEAEIIEAVEDMPEGFFSTVNSNRSDYIEKVKGHKLHRVLTISDVDGYNSKFTELSKYVYGLPYDKLSEAIETLKERAKEYAERK